MSGKTWQQDSQGIYRNGSYLNNALLQCITLGVHQELCVREWWGAIAQCSYRLLASWWHLLPCLQSVCWYIENFRPMDSSQGVKELSNISWATLAGSLSKGRRHTSQEEILGLHFLGILLVCLLAMELTVFHWQLKLLTPR